MHMITIAQTIAINRRLKMEANKEGVTLEKKGSYAVLTVDIPETRNALSVPVLEHMEGLIDDLAKDKDIHCLILTGGGEKSFIAGADIRQLVKMSPEDSRYSIEVGHRVFSKIEMLPYPTIAAVNGYCLGGGLEIAMSCDIRICSANARFGQPEINIAMIPGWGATLRLQRMVGESRAKWMLLTGKMIDPDTALDWGLVMKVCESISDLRENAEALAKDLASKSPVTIKYDKQMIYDSRNKQPTDIAQRDANTLGLLFTTHDAKEGLSAFLEKRKPQYEGR